MKKLLLLLAVVLTASVGFYAKTSSDEATVAKTKDFTLKVSEVKIMGAKGKKERTVMVFADRKGTQFIIDRGILKTPELDAKKGKDDGPGTAPKPNCMSGSQVGPGTEYSFYEECPTDDTKRRECKQWVISCRSQGDSEAHYEYGMKVCGRCISTGGVSNAFETEAAW